MMIDLNYGENYREEILLKHQIEEKISSSLGIAKNQVMLNYGSNSNLILFFSAYSVKFLNEKKRKLKILLDFPNYFFTITQLKEWFIEANFVKRDEEMNFPFENFIKKIREFKPDVILLTTPNNPTGKPIKNEEIIKIINSASKDTIILIDRSCVNVLPEISTKELLAKFKNKKIVVLHSFSKSHSLSDERLGYLTTNSIEITEFLYNKRDLNHNINAVKKLIKILDDEKILKQKRETIQKCNSILKEYFEKKNSKYFESYSNFALIQLPLNLTSEFVEESLSKKDILVMRGHKIGLGNRYIRLHMSGISEIKKFIQEFEKIEK
ncbi:hypothetical protein CO057_03960 [Candidatus Uhrbacteria bacterium CG_4_9_14_0_2_um_filter_41_50]|uniref:Aminotransferase class I/classII large domain-containing protein n=1 Tax=Candidatus Uhrbacteria bacterium CG_4_9_14_0_2_um_filter_41_50 TaxID=1975031 RepID=A0A2M8END5_9BACT|nr:MAG: hypothetical protein COZ45_01860 [Candidatus Uhrbacteria bacterium CG_4_10_14_3_um_filter_41_21]PIZ55382.1 MAG: hypothetical protein COY24_00645 [Candidatus Uhrbacteria bacterium CG_4_10_14_0_2_um_filter_41_21]PJB84304.1 MAG: hypothetical protein CO086_04410 [Candidatus Uhrbacteria bacterium CG_4_9_14_0_8_um_filter_41_16]PJC24250.1 MAG: hypothetical protein CO057_03960 [Candidatus Uhrbacteria bacterium CG_4_9_14_0_2_um_filter_41_50]